MSVTDRHCGDCPFTVGQWAELTALLCLDPAVHDERVGDALLTALTVDQVVSAELDYLRTALRMGWTVWELADTGPLDGG